MERKLILTAALLGAAAIVLGAFGAHALKEVLNQQQLNIFETGVRYQMYHALFLLLVGTSAHISDKAKTTILYLTSVGILFFSGSLYLLAARDLVGFNVKTI